MWSVLNHSPFLPSVGSILQCLNILRMGVTVNKGVTSLCQSWREMGAGPTLTPESTQCFLLSPSLFSGSGNPPLSIPVHSMIHLPPGALRASQTQDTISLPIWVRPRVAMGRHHAQRPGDGCALPPSWIDQISTVCLLSIWHHTRAGSPYMLVQHTTL